MGVHRIFRTENWVECLSCSQFYLLRRETHFGIKTLVAIVMFANEPNTFPLRVEARKKASSFTIQWAKRMNALKLTGEQASSQAAADKSRRQSVCFKWWINGKLIRLVFMLRLIKLKLYRHCFCGVGTITQWIIITKAIVDSTNPHIDLYIFSYKSIY